MICTECVYDSDCSMKSTCVDRCNVFLKNKGGQIGDNSWVDLIDKIQMNHDDLTDLLKELDIELK